MLQQVACRRAARFVLSDDTDGRPPSCRLGPPSLFQPGLACCSKHANPALSSCHCHAQGEAAVTWNAVGRRVLLHQGLKLAAGALLGVPYAAVVALPASASKLGEGADKAWEAMGGGPPDLFFPSLFLGRWQVCLLPSVCR
jgi:hypothetical protein